MKCDVKLLNQRVYTFDSTRVQRIGTVALDPWSCCEEHRDLRDRLALRNAQRTAQRCLRELHLRFLRQRKVQATSSNKCENMCVSNSKDRSDIKRLFNSIAARKVIMSLPFTILMWLLSCKALRARQLQLQRQCFTAMAQWQLLRYAFQCLAGRT